MMPYLPSKIKDEAVINPYIVMLDNDYKEIAFSVRDSWFVIRDLIFNWLWYGEENDWIAFSH